MCFSTACIYTRYVECKKNQSSQNNICSNQKLRENEVDFFYGNYIFEREIILWNAIKHKKIKNLSIFKHPVANLIF